MTEENLKKQADMGGAYRSCDCVIEEKQGSFWKKEKLIVSYHEVGHALVAALQTNSCT